MRIVLDTNVLVSGLLNPHGVPGEIIRLVVSSRVTLCVDARILAEYEEVIHRPRFQINPQQARVFMDFIRASSEVWSAAPLPDGLPDEDDQAFLEVAVSAKVSYLVTGNLKHYPDKKRQGVKVVAPGDFKVLYNRTQASSDE